MYVVRSTDPAGASTSGVFGWDHPLPYGVKALKDRAALCSRPLESRGSPVPLWKAQGTHEVCVLGILAGLHPAQGALVPGSQRWTAAGFGTEAALESEYTVNTWSIE